MRGRAYNGVRRIENDREVRHVPPDGGRELWVFGGLVRFLVLGEETGGAFTLFEEETSPGDGALPHLHHAEDQALYVLEGEHEFTCDGRTFSAGTGSLVYAPKGTVHSFRNVGMVRGRLLIFSAPAGGTEAFLFEVGEPAEGTSAPRASRPPEGFEGIARLRKTARKHGSDIDTLALLRALNPERKPDTRR